MAEFMAFLIATAVNILSSCRVSVLRDVLRPQRGDAQAVGDVQEDGRNHQAGPAVLIQRGEGLVQFDS